MTYISSNNNRTMVTPYVAATGAAVAGGSLPLLYKCLSDKSLPFTKLQTVKEKRIFINTYKNVQKKMNLDFGKLSISKTTKYVKECLKPEIKPLKVAKRTVKGALAGTIIGLVIDFAKDRTQK